MKTGLAGAVVVGVCSVACMAGPGAAVHVRAEGATAFNPGVGAFQGPATFELDGVAHSVFASTVPVEMRSLPNGMVHATTSHTFDFGGGDTITTLDHAILRPTGAPGLYELDSSLNLTGGTGRFHRVNGHLHGLPGSTIDLFAGQAQWSCEGVFVVRH